MFKQRYTYLMLFVALNVFLVACSSAANNAQDQGNLQFRANGEDFVRQGFVSKDGWDIAFDNVWVNINSITAYQTDPPYDPDEMQGNVESKVELQLPQAYQIDLAMGDDTADPILVDELMAQAGRYNALSWQLVPATEGEMNGSSMILIGTASKDGQTVDFTLNVAETYTNYCGDFVGDERKGILEADSVADLEMTFHFDHIFGDVELAADDSLNEAAVGFGPFASVANNGVLDASLDDLAASWSESDYQTLQRALNKLAHTGEGHCYYGG